jgi:hypothetical protein
MTKLNMAIVTAATLALIGCGGGGGSSSGAGNNDDSPGGTAGNGSVNSKYTYFPSSAGSDAPIIIQRMTGALYAQQLFSPTHAKYSEYSDMYCFDNGAGKSKEIRWAIGSPGHNDASIKVTEYDEENCTGNTSVSKANYTYSLGNFLDNDKSIEIDFIFKDGDNITSLLPGNVFGHDTTQTFYTILTTSGDAYSNNQDLRIGIAQPDNMHDGLTKQSRARDLSAFENKDYFFGQYGTGRVN